MAPMSVFKAGATALITGGSSGVGLAVAHLCLKHGMRTAIVDINPATLELARENLGGDVETYQADVSNEADWQRVKDAVGTRFGEVDFLMLNAGVGTKSTWGDADYFQKVFSTNLFGVIHGLNAFVPAFKARSTPGTIVITGSKRGITNSPGNPAYNASKAAVKTLAEHLSFDLRDTSTSVHLLMPGSTFTGLSGNAPGSSTPKPPGAWLPSQVAKYMYDKILEDKFYILCPDDDVSEEIDRKRMLWAVGDVVQGRPALARWREGWEGEWERWMGGEGPDV